MSLIPVFSDFRGKRAVVTGAGGVVGSAIALALARQGAEVFAIDLTEPRLTGCTGLAVNVQDRDAIRRAAEMAKGASLIVNSHGLQIRSDAMSGTDDAFARIFDVNVGGAWRIAQEFGKQLEGKPGAIVNITSINGITAARTGALYGASKAALNHLTRIMALELSPAVRVNAVAPTVVRSKMTEDLFRTPEYEAAKIEAIPLKRIATAEDVAAATLFLLSDASSMITGQVIAVDGGISLP